MLTAQDGSVASGWIAPAVLYAKLSGRISGPLGHAYAKRIGKLIAPIQQLCFFCDASELRYYDLLARSVLARSVLANRRKFSLIAFLTTNNGISAVVDSLVRTLREPVEVLTRRESFESRVLHKAPLSLRKLDQSNWFSADRSQVPPR